MTAAANVVVCRLTDPVRPALTAPLPSAQMAAVLRGLLPMPACRDEEEARPAA